MNEKRILNVGCGLDLRGTDRIDVVKTPATTKVCDLEKRLPYPDLSFDEIICYHVLGHIRNMKLFMDECYRVLKNGGKIILRTSNAGYLVYHILHDHCAEVEVRNNNIKKTEGDFVYGHDHHYHLFQPNHLRYLFEEANFRNINITYIQVQENKLKKFLLQLLPFNLGKMVIEVKAEK